MIDKKPRKPLRFYSTTPDLFGIILFIIGAGFLLVALYNFLEALYKKIRKQDRAPLKGSVILIVLAIIMIGQLPLRNGIVKKNHTSSNSQHCSTECQSPLRAENCTAKTDCTAPRLSPNKEGAE